MALLVSVTKIGLDVLSPAGEEWHVNDCGWDSRGPHLWLTRPDRVKRKRLYQDEADKGWKVQRRVQPKRNV